MSKPMKTINNAPTDRENLEWLVWYAWQKEIISMTRGVELLGTDLETMREWLMEYNQKHKKELEA